MNLTGACRCAAAFVSFLSIFVPAFASNCNPETLTPAERLTRFQAIDKAAQSAMEQQMFAEAAQHYREEACLVPTSARAFYGLGVAEAAAANFPRPATLFARRRGFSQRMRCR